METNPFSGFAFDRLRFEYERRERALRDIKEDLRREMDEWESMIDREQIYGPRMRLRELRSQDEAKFSERIRQLQSELNQIMDVMNA